MNRIETNRNEVEKVLADHVLWVNGDSNGKRANLQGANLWGANLQGAYLRGANLQGAYLRGADLQGAYLRGAYLRGAYLQGAYLQGTDLRRANLRGADLQGANLQEADLRRAYLPMFCTWTHGIVDGAIQIGCKTKSIEEWDAFFASDEVYTTDRGTPEFVQIQAVYESYKAYLKVINKQQDNEK
jgi:hypothetical protein